MSDRVASAAASDAASEEEILSSLNRDQNNGSSSSSSNEYLTKEEVDSKLQTIRDQFGKRISLLEDKLASLNRELENERQCKEEAEAKLQMMRDQYEKDISSLEGAQPSKLIKDMFSKQYIDRQKQLDKTKDELIQQLKDESGRRKDELYKTRMKLSQAEKKNEELSKKLAELEEKRNSHSSFNDSRIPSPPPVDYGNIFQELSIKSSTSPKLGDYSCTDGIPPPPPVDVPLEDLMRQNEYYSQQHHDDNLSRHEAHNLLNN